MTKAPSNPGRSLRESLNYEPQPLNFGTSGRRGLVVHLTQLEIYINALAELEYLLSLPVAEGGIRPGDEFFYARDLRPSSSAYVAAEQGRGELAQAVEQAVRDAGLRPVNLGCIPTPALSYYAFRQQRGSIMVTGSHIPFERNGYKTNTSRGELLKKDEAPINARVAQVRERIYAQPCEQSLFGPDGRFKTGHRELSPETDAARRLYIQRYLEFFGAGSLKGLTLLAYQHSAVGRDLLVEVLQGLGAEVVPAGRSESFVPIDTENMDDAQLARIQELVDAAVTQGHKLDAVVSTDGDSDRPLLLGLEKEGERTRVRFFGGDLVGMIVAEFLGADAVVVPISCNDALDRGVLRDRLEPKTRIGSPFVVAGLEAARAKGRRRVCGWEANGGFLTGSDFERGGCVLTALPTRDALLPILGVLSAMAERRYNMVDLFGRLPKRFSKAALLKQFPRPVSQRIIAQFSPLDPQIKEVTFNGDELKALDEHGSALSGLSPASLSSLLAIRARLAGFFTPVDGFGKILKINYIDGVRLYFNNGEVAHVRPSGNADELRVYAVADTAARAEAIARLGVAEPNGLLRQMEHSVA